MNSFQHSLPDPYRIARFYAKLAVRALYDELALFPKPGLVSFVDAGAHHDMNARLLFRSLFSLRHYFFQVSLCATLGHPPAQLVRWGLAAEQTMYRTTNGINTHKGAIFALGIVCASVSKLSQQKNSFSMMELQQHIIDDWAVYLSAHHQNKNTHGSQVKDTYQVHDAKHMAITGYHLVFHTLQDLQEVHHDKIFMGILAYQRFLNELDDLNVLYRVGPEGLHYARQQIQQGISITHKENSITTATHLHQLFSRKNISPGGVADMISVLYFLHALFYQQR